MADFQNLTPQEVKEILKDPSVGIIDVRTLGEFEKGALPRAQLIPLHELPKKLSELPQDKNSPLLIYCAHGVRSLHAIGFLESCGYSHLMNLKGGLAAFLNEITED